MITRRQETGNKKKKENINNNKNMEVNKVDTHKVTEKNEHKSNSYPIPGRQLIQEYGFGDKTNWVNLF
jgi:hypothetical protein